jgi:hypothetical protein
MILLFLKNYNQKYPAEIPHSSARKVDSKVWGGELFSQTQKIGAYLLDLKIGQVRVRLVSRDQKPMQPIGAGPSALRY